MDYQSESEITRIAVDVNLEKIVVGYYGTPALVKNYFSKVLQKTLGVNYGTIGTIPGQ